MDCEITLVNLVLCEKLKRDNNYLNDFMYSFLSKFSLRYQRSPIGEEDELVGRED